jgi:hypothetical protein
MKLYELENIVVGTTMTMLKVKGDEPCEVRCKFGNIPKAFKLASVEAICIHGSSDDYGTYKQYLQIEITDL